MIFTREAYLSQLAQKKQNGMIKIITGLRRCGKSYLLFKLFYDKLVAEGVPKSHIVKIPLDDLEYAELRDKMALYKFIKSKIKDKKQYYCLLDEIQLVEGFEEVLNSLLHIENVDVYVTGSNSRFLVKDVITEFRGRGDEIRMYPLSFKEFFEGRKDDFSSAWTDYYTYGGLPLVATMKNHKEKSDYLDNLFSKVYLTDVVDRYSIRNKAEFEELLDVVASSIGSPANPVKIENTFKSKKKSTITHKTITSYLNYLDDAFLIQTAERFDIKGRKYIGANKKYYFSDVGLRNARLNFRQLEESHIMENIIYNELKMRGYNVDVGIVECRAKDKNGSLRQIQLECDFVANLGNEKIYIQSALNLADEKKKAQEENSLLKINDSFKKVIVQKEKVVPHYDENGIYIVCLEDFLLGTVL
ncbi:ATP-binding protein [Candidatus Saccharibacteria bacterium]|nr:ATP-binding protein [Candidatus Saccharibacteria bacterium]